MPLYLLPHLVPCAAFPAPPQCVPAHRLVERTAVSSLREVRKRHADALKANRHLRYMWIPNTDTVVVVTCNPVPEVR